MKKFLIIFFISFIFLGFVLTVGTKDKEISVFENKVLTTMPKLTLDSIASKDFMKEFDKYTSDQFPFRFDFIKLKNNFEYIIGKREFRNIYISNEDKLIESFTLNEYILNKNINSINSIAKNSILDSKLILIPNSIAFYSDTLPAYAIYDSQEDVLNNIKDKIDISYYNGFDILNKHKDECIYFKTDHHWTQLGAKYVYEDLYNTTVSDDYIEVSKDFYGTYYSKAPIYKVKPDNIYAYLNYSKFDIIYDYNKKSNSLYDESKLDGKNKYQYFLNGDPAIALIDGSGYGEVLIFKDSYAHNFIPFLASEYDTIHVIDPRYYNGNVNSYIKENPNISQIIFIHNLSSINSDLLYKGVK